MERRTSWTYIFSHIFHFCFISLLEKKSPFQKASYLSHIWEIYSVSITQAATGGAIEYVVARGLGRRGGGKELCWGFFFLCLEEGQIVRH